jgi:cell division protein FtsL
MANLNNAEKARRTANNARHEGMYVDGSTVRKLQEVPARTYEPRRAPVRRKPEEQPTQVQPKKQKVLSEQTRQNRERAMGMSKGFVVFLTVISVAILFCCIHYLQLKSEITASIKTVASLESELSELKEDNDAYYSQVTSNVDMNTIKKIAIGRLGMKYPSEDQIMTYETEGSSYVRQYQDIPDSK